MVFQNSTLPKYTNSCFKSLGTAALITAGIDNCQSFAKKNGLPLKNDQKTALYLMIINTLDLFNIRRPIANNC